MPAFAAVLLDAENLRLAESEEHFIQNCCQYPLRLKIAIANWKNMGTQDAVYHLRGWHLCQVPAGTNNADGRLIALGSTLPFRNPDLAEVVVVSTDWLLNQLCTELVNQGMVVHQASRAGKWLHVTKYGATDSTASVFTSNNAAAPVFIPNPVVQTGASVQAQYQPDQPSSLAVPFELPTTLKTVSELKTATQFILKIIAGKTGIVSLVELGAEFKRCYGIGIREACQHVGSKQKPAAFFKSAGFKIVSEQTNVFFQVS